jgi:hypothetical protein
MQKPYRMGRTSVPILVPNSCRRGGIHALARVWNRTLILRGCSVVPGASPMDSAPAERKAKFGAGVSQQLSYALDAGIPTSLRGRQGV